MAKAGSVPEALFAGKIDARFLSSFQLDIHYEIDNPPARHRRLIGCRIDYSKILHDNYTDPIIPGNRTITRRDGVPDAASPDLPDSKNTLAFSNT